MWARGANGVYCHSADAGISDTCGVIWIDINGKKAPNTLGKDIFILYITKNSIKATLDNTCTTNSGGWGCTKWVLEKGNMDYLRN